jgi:hypothetical protein
VERTLTDFTYYNDIEETRTSILNNDDGDIFKYEINEDDLVDDDDFGFRIDGTSSNNWMVVIF